MCWFSVAGASAFRVGDQGSDVAEIQGQLANLGYDVTALVSRTSSAARRRTVSTARVTSAMYSPMPVSTCRARLMHSMRSATRFPRASSCRATLSSSRRMSRVRRTSASILAMVISSMHRRARVYQLHPCTVPIGVPAISVPVASCNLFGEGQASLSLFLRFYRILRILPKGWNHGGSLSSVPDHPDVCLCLLG